MVEITAKPKFGSRKPGGGAATPQTTSYLIDKFPRLWI